MFEPLHIRAYLQTPVISDRFLPFDSILYNQFIRDNMGPKDFTKPRESTVREYSGLWMPILKQNVDTPDWYYACSFAVWPEETIRGKHEYAKRFDTHEGVKYLDFQGKRGKIDTARGANKNYFIKEYTFCAPYVEWYCRGKKDQLELLLPFITHVGKKSSQGCGSVLRWEINQTDKDWFKRDDKGRRMRAIPSENGPAVYGIRPSYWEPRHQTTVYLPD